ncbi:MAG TPA: hypothetical protein VHW09_02440 [Bryobacteraceae bacterium]|jgi:hypothetical protein|nr:hypothetical protein [Bryobacteraceae bacterium]
MRWGRIVFGASAVLFGVIALMWHDPDTWQTLSRIWSLPFGTAIGGCLMIGQIAGGLAMQQPKAAHPASMVLGIVYLLFSLACVPAIVAAPAVYVHYGSFFEQFSLLCGALALYAATVRDGAAARGVGRAARVGLGLCAISFTLSQTVYLSMTAVLVPTWLPPNQTFWAILTTIAFALAAISLLTNRHAGLALRLTTAMLALFGASVWIPRLIAHPEVHLNWSEFSLTLLITGAFWMGATSPAARRR